MTFLLRPIRPDDRDPLYAIHRAAMGDYVSAVWGWDEDVQRDFWTRTAHDGVQVIEVDGRLAGYLDLREEDGAFDVVNIVLDPSMQGSGIGSAILRDVLDRARAANTPVRLQVLKVNPKAHALYRRLGFGDTDETATHIRMVWQP